MKKWGPMKCVPRTCEGETNGVPLQPHSFPPQPDFGFGFTPLQPALSGKSRRWGSHYNPTFEYLKTKTSKHSRYTRTKD
eukprot:5203890-Amphidinium_carterae.1